ncbi:MAG: iron chelate uptake ABC transporter family permease subunit, partial [Acidobacteriota bacterium]
MLDFFDLSWSARNVLVGASLLGVVGGVLGCFTLLRRQSLLSDALAHAALPGVCLAYLLSGGSKQPLVLFAGALVAGLIGAFVVLGVVRWSRTKEDAAIGIVLSVFFGVGIVLLTAIQRMPIGNQSGLDKFLFGQAATLLPRDVALMATLGAIVLTLVIVFFKEFALLSFDADYGASLGLPMRRFEQLLTVLLVIVVVVGLQTVGVVLMVATLVTPAAAARQWTERLSVMLVIAGAIGGGAGAIGALLSARVAQLPTGPVIVLVSSAVLLASLLFAPDRGLLGAALRRRRLVQRVRRENLLKDLYLWGERHPEQADAPVPVAWLLGERWGTPGVLRATAARLRRDGALMPSADGGGLSLTDDGAARAMAVVRKHRLWEVYLTHRLALASDHVHRDAELMEHILDDRAIAELDARL